MSTTTHLEIDRLEGATDTAHLEKAIEAVPHVQSVEFDVPQNRAIVTHDGANPEKLAAAVRDLGYSARVK